MVNSFQKRSRVFVWKMLQTPLQYPASIRMRGKIKYMISKEWKKCEAFRLYDFDKLLDNLDHMP